jgi:retron-type reverse transcriptase
MSISLKIRKMPTKIAIKGKMSFKTAGEVTNIKRKHTTQMATGNQAAIKKIIVHLFIDRRKIKTRVMMASTIA